MRRLLLVLAAAAACSKSNDPTASEESAFVAEYDGGNLPFPSDQWRRPDGTIDVPLAALSRYVPNERGAGYIREAFARTYGFGVYGGAIFAVTGKADRKTLKDSAVIVDLDANALVESQVAFNDDSVFGEEETKPAIVVRTARGVVLPEGHRVAVLLTDAIKSTTGAPLRRSVAFDAFVKSPAAWLNSALTKVPTGATVVAATMYTTGKVTEDTLIARDVIRALPAPTLKWDDVAPVSAVKFGEGPGYTATLDALLGTPRKIGDVDDPDFARSNTGVAHDALGALGVATFEAPSFLIDAGSFSDPNHGTFYRAAGKPAVFPGKPTARIWVTFTVPRAPPPAAGYPVLVFQHGLGGQRRDMMAIANVAARRGYAVAAIEAVLLATRSLDARARGDKKNDVARSGSTYLGPDGFIDQDESSLGGASGSTDLFGGLFRQAAMRDQFRQSVLDHVTLLHLLESSPSLEALMPGAKIDGTKVAYMGSSLGGIIGTMVAGIEPNHRAYILNVPGAGVFGELAPNSPRISGLLTGAAALFFGLRRAQTPTHHPLAQIMQHLFDGGDPIAYAGLATTRNVLVIECLRDEILSNQSTEALARAMGIPVVKPHGPLYAPLTEVDGPAVIDVPKKGHTAAMIQLFPAEHGQELFVKTGKREYSVAEPTYGDPQTEIFARLPKPVTFDHPYLELHEATFSFIDDAFAGKTPTLRWSLAPAPVRD